VVGDENDIDVVNHNDDVTRSYDTLLGNVEIVTDDKDAQIESNACNGNIMSNAVVTCKIKKSCATISAAVDDRRKIILLQRVEMFLKLF